MKKLLPVVALFASASAHSAMVEYSFTAKMTPGFGEGDVTYGGVNPESFRLAETITGRVLYDSDGWTCQPVADLGFQDCYGGYALLEADWGSFSSVYKAGNLLVRDNGFLSFRAFWPAGESYYYYTPHEIEGLLIAGDAPEFGFGGAVTDGQVPSELNITSGGFLDVLRIMDPAVSSSPGSAVAGITLNAQFTQWHKVPEPQPFALFAAGLLAIGVYRFRRETR